MIDDSFTNLIYIYLACQKVTVRSESIFWQYSITSLELATKLNKKMFKSYFIIEILLNQIEQKILI